MKYLVVGGTGSLGKALVKRLLIEGNNEIKIVSRSELNQKQMSQEFGFDDRLTFVLGDIRDRDSMFRHFSGIDVAFCFAALKHVDVMEENPEESVKTNILGTINMADAAQSCRVPHVVFSSTDKAVDPVNVYGACKFISEKILFRRNELQLTTKYTIFRWGNVLFSRGSALQSFTDSLKSSGKVKITDREMTRFFIRIEDAVEFMLKNYQTADRGKPSIPDMKAANILTIVECLADILGLSSYEIEDMPVRRGEKLHEAIRSAHEDPNANSLHWEKFSKEELKSLIERSI